MKPSFLPIKKLDEEPYYTIIGYPKATKKQINSRIHELKNLGIKSLSFQGGSQLGRLRVLGKGYAGIVVMGKLKNKIVAVKIRRTDSPRTSLKDESNFLRIANKMEIGPLLIKNSRNFMIMEFLDGEKIGKWIIGLKNKKSCPLLKSSIKKILQDCYSLDKIGVDHGELSNISKHVIVGKKTTLIDFESASTRRRAANVTSATQAIFIGSGISKIARKICTFPSKTKIINALRIYKQQKDSISFEKILETLKL